MANMIQITKEANKILSDAIEAISNTLELLRGPKQGKSNSAPRPEPQGLLDDLTLMHQKAMAVLDLSIALRDVVSGKDLDAPEAGYDPRY